MNNLIIKIILWVIATLLLYTATCKGLNKYKIPVNQYYVIYSMILMAGVLIGSLF